MASGAKSVRCDVSRVFEEYVGGRGLSLAGLDDLLPPAAEAVREVQAHRREGWRRWMDLPFQTEAVEASRRLWDRLRDDLDGGIEDFVVLGIGGSALGTTCLATALLSPVHNALPREARGGVPRIRVLDNVDPDWLAAHLAHLDPKRTVVNVITKSGTTAETMAQFLLARKLLSDALGDGWRRRVVCTTDPARGVLRKLAADEGLATLPVPDGVGGRFSVFSAVGLFPAVALGMDADALLEGARAMDEACRSEDPWANPALMRAAILRLASLSGISVHVMMPYAQGLKDYADWYRQLLAESLGKARSLEGAVVNAGLTPAKALGVTDQHSQIQLYVEGPFDKLVTIVAVDGFADPGPLPDLYPGVDELAYLGGRSLAELLDAERRGTEAALEAAGRPYEVVAVPRVDARSLGELVAHAELSIAYAGPMFGVDAFDQPGVEAGKRASHALMGRKGFEEEARRLSGRKPADGRFVL